MATTTDRGWRRLIRWPVFCAVGAVHILLLPLLLSEPSDQLLAVVAGGLYLVLAAADRRYGPQPA